MVAWAPASFLGSPPAVTNLNPERMMKIKARMPAAKVRTAMMRVASSPKLAVTAGGKIDRSMMKLYAR